MIAQSDVCLRAVFGSRPAGLGLGALAWLQAASFRLRALPACWHRWAAEIVRICAGALVPPLRAG
eukprot:11266769-Alexandrium_andersonii.AAC.1